ncbi:MAG: hypothetical protein OM95_04775 [Bdellovibrio sp. ArHS]|uniref:hypothetical protein n=1 Tax=Bdellovibrio sp. ArHS TaxID=1569284 RepID=UPI000582E3B0|nr:hypothetical protein [Bdellovibrio sp. ArHS]KHD89144.1 MAG: hypothetical protein OM95_04775 [Bdellovibrio sp. ArHS]
MKKIFLIAFFLPAISSGQNIVLQSPSANPVEYENSIDRNPDTQSWIHYLEKSLQSNSSQEDRFLKLGDDFPEHTDRVLISLKELQQQAPMTLISLRFARDLSEKALAQNLSPADKKEFQHLYCKGVVLLNEGPARFPCSTEYISLAKLAKKYSFHKVVLIESVPVPLNEKSALELSPQTAYHWTLASNSHTPVRFYGTYNQLMNQHFVSEPAVEGSCGQFSHRLDDFDILHRASVFFDTSCMQRLKQDEIKKSWVTEKKTWLYIAGAMALGGLVYSLKDKEVTVNTLLK